MLDKIQHYRYLKIKDDIDQNLLSEDKISLIFIHKYPIFKQLDMEDRLNDYEYYKELYKQNNCEHKYKQNMRGYIDNTKNKINKCSIPFEIFENEEDDEFKNITFK